MRVKEAQTEPPSRTRGYTISFVGYYTKYCRVVLEKKLKGAHFTASTLLSFHFISSHPTPHVIDLLALLYFSPFWIFTCTLFSFATCRMPHAGCRAPGAWVLGWEVTFLECGETCVGYPVIISVTLTVCDPTGYAISACRMSGQSGVRACGFFENSPRLRRGGRVASVGRRRQNTPIGGTSCGALCADARRWRGWGEACIKKAGDG